MAGYTREQRLRAVRVYERYDRSAASVINELGYPSHEVLARWVDELEPGRRRLWRVPVDEPTGRRAVAGYASGEATSRRIGEELGVSADVVRNWKHTMLSHDDKEHGMHDEDARHGTEPVRDDPAPAPARDGRSRVCAGNATSSSRSWRPCGPNVWNSRSRQRPSYTRQLLGKERGADPDNLTNAGKTRLVLHPAGMFAMRPRDLWGRFGLSRSTFHHNRQRPDRPGRREWLVEPVMDAFRQSRERYGYRRIWQMPRERGIRVCARRVMRVMSAHGITPRFKSRRRYGSYSGERSPAPANLVDAASTPKAPNRLWAADITELHIGEGEIYLSPVIDC